MVLVLVGFACSDDGVRVLRQRAMDASVPVDLPTTLLDLRDGDIPDLSSPEVSEDVLVPPSEVQEVQEVQEVSVDTDNAPPGSWRIAAPGSP